MARPITPAIDRALLNFKVTPLGCWEYQGTRNVGGYGVIGQGRALKWLAHRLVYMHEVGPIPAGLTLDHLCFNPCCINPAHLEPVSLAENTRRQTAAGRSGAGWQRHLTHCKRGHEFTPANTRGREGHRHCRTCEREYQRLRYLKWKENQ